MSLPPKALATAKTSSTQGVELVKASISLMTELVEVMAKEMELVTERKLEEHKELLKRKQRLTIDYRANIKSIAMQPDVLKALPEDLRRTVKVVAQKLADMSDRNAKYLRVAVVATQRLIQNVVAVVKQEVLPKSTYGNASKAHLELGSYSPTCKPVAVNRTA